MEIEIKNICNQWPRGKTGQNILLVMHKVSCEMVHMVISAVDLQEAAVPYSSTESFCFILHV